MTEKDNGIISPIFGNSPTMFRGGFLREMVNDILVDHYTHFYDTIQSTAKRAAAFEKNRDTVKVEQLDHFPNLTPETPLKRKMVQE